VIDDVRGRAGAREGVAAVTGPAREGPATRSSIFESKDSCFWWFMPLPLDFVFILVQTRTTLIYYKVLILNLDSAK
jgi:hypothetical protein